MRCLARQRKRERAAHQQGRLPAKPSTRRSARSSGPKPPRHGELIRVSWVKELPPQAFQSPNGACSRATTVACGRFILRPARLQMETSRSLGNPNLANPGRGREDTGSFGGVTPGVTVQRADGGKWILMGLVAFVWALGQSACSAPSPRGHMQAPGLHLRQCNTALRPSERRVRCELACIG